MIPSTEGEPAGLPDAAVLAAAVARMDRVGRGDGGTVDDGDGDGDDCTSDDGGTSDDDQNQDVNQGVDAAQAGGIGEDDDLDDASGFVLAAAGVPVVSDMGFLSPRRSSA